MRTLVIQNKSFILNDYLSTTIHVLKQKGLGLFSNKWVYYEEDERGGWEHYNLFGLEEDACDFVYNLALNDSLETSNEEIKKSHWKSEEFTRTISCLPKTVKRLKSVLKELKIPAHLFSLNNPSSPTSYYLKKRLSPHWFHAPVWFLYTKDSHGYIRNGRTYVFEDSVCSDIFIEAKWIVHKYDLYKN